MIENISLLTGIHVVRKKTIFLCNMLIFFCNCFIKAVCGNYLEAVYHNDLYCKIQTTNQMKIK